MCIEIFRDPGAALGRAAKGRDMKKTALVLVEAAVMAAAAMIIVSAKASGIIGAPVLTLAANVVALVIGAGVLGGFVLRVVANALGLKGAFFDGVTALAYAFIPISAGLLIASLLALVPLGIFFGLIALAILFALGIAVLYRGILVLFRADMVTAFVIVTVIALSLIVAMQASLGINVLTSLGAGAIR